jgi:hypothetical protein
MAPFILARPEFGRLEQVDLLTRFPKQGDIDKIRRIFLRGVLDKEGNRSPLASSTS